MLSRTIAALLAAGHLAACGAATTTPTPPPTIPVLPTPFVDQAALQAEQVQPVLFTSISRPLTPFEETHPLDTPDLMLFDGQTYHLDPAWRVASVEYAHKWWGLSAESVLAYHVLPWNGAAYQDGGVSLDPLVVQSLLDGLRGLTVQSQAVAGIACCDSYPSWALELVGEDGQRVFVVSLSNTNDGAVPWNVLYRGRVYVLWEKSIAPAFGILYPNSRFFGSELWGEVGSIRALGDLPQQEYGFSGLTPIWDAFTYQPDAGSGQIRGQIAGRSSPDGLGRMIVGNLTELIDVRLSAPDGGAVACRIERMQQEGYAGVVEFSALWQFRCPAQSAGVAEGTTYRYHVALQFLTADGEMVTTTGELWGEW